MPPEKAISVKPLAFSLVVFFLTIVFTLYAIPYTLPPVFAANVGDSCVYSQDARMYDEKRPQDDQSPPVIQNDPNDTGVECFTGQCTSSDCGFNNNCQFNPDKSPVQMVDCPGTSSTGGSSTASPSPTTTNQSTVDTAAAVGAWNAGDQWQYMLGNALGSVGCIGVGKSSIPLGDCIGFSPTGSITKFAQIPDGGALGAIDRMIAALYANPPATGGTYLADVGRNLGVVRPALAQGLGTGNSTGDAVLTPVLKMWKVMRNLSYLIFIVIFVVVGLMIMFRRKINPQTVISVQTALPGLVIGLILVTFSYFLAALIIDFSYVSMSLVGFIFSQSGLENYVAGVPGTAGPTSLSQTINALATQGNIFGLGWSFISNALLTGTVIPYFTNLFDISSLTNSIAGSQGGAANTNSFAWNVITGQWAAASSQVVGNLLTGVLYLAGLFVTAALIIAILIQMLRLFWALVTAYITVLIFSILGPLLITVGSIPGRGGAITYWWKTLLANILIFPAVFGTILFAGMFLANTGTFTTALPLFNGIPTEILAAIIGYGIILGSPAVPGMVKQAMGVKDIAEFQKAALGAASAGFNLGVKTPLQKTFSSAYAPFKQQGEARRAEYLRQYYGQKDKAAVESGKRIDSGWFGNLMNKWIYRLPGK